MKRVPFAVALLVAVLAPPAAGHTRSQSFSTWSVDGGDVRATFSVPSFEVTRIPAEREHAPLSERLIGHLASRVRLLAAGADCPPAGAPRALAARPGFERVEWRFACPSGRPLELGLDAFFDVVPSHVHFARLRDGSGLAEFLYTDAVRHHVVRGAEPAGSAFPAYIALGFEHILEGLDHLAFVAALLILCRRPRDVVLLVTGFTLGHSVTLGLAVFDVVRSNAPVVESLIGFTIALVALENAVTGERGRRVAWACGLALLALALFGAATGSGLPLPTLVGLAVFSFCHLQLAADPVVAARLRPVLTVAFGLIHGLGFAGVLVEMGLPRERLVAALLGFNLGVELGQLAVVALLSAVALAFARRVRAARVGLVSDAASAGLCALGVYWFVGRGFS